MTNDDVFDALRNVNYPGFTKNIVTFGFVKNIAIDGESVSLDVDITSSAEEVKVALIKDVEVELQKIGFKNITATSMRPSLLASRATLLRAKTSPRMSRIS